MNAPIEKPYKRKVHSCPMCTERPPIRESAGVVYWQCGAWKVIDLRKPDLSTYPARFPDEKSNKRSGQEGPHKLLSQAQKDQIRVYVMQGMTGPEIAVLIDHNEHTVKKWCSRVRKELRAGSGSVCGAKTMITRGGECQEAGL